LGALGQFSSIEAFIPIKPASSLEIIDTFQLPLNKLNDGLELFKINELIFCSLDVSNQEIIETMAKHSESNLEYKIAPKNREYIIGSSSIDITGDVYKLLESNSINSSENSRKKIIFDVFCSFILVLLFPLWIKKTNSISNTFLNLFKTIVGHKSIIGYNMSVKNTLLPKLKPGILSPKDATPELNITADILNEQNIAYAKNYSSKRDFNILLKSLKSLGN